MDFLNAVYENLLSPPILFFALGLLASLLKSDLSFPPDLAKGLSLYLLISIGFEGGTKLAQTGISPQVTSTLIAGMALGLIFPFIGYVALRRITNPVDAAAIAAHYGSVSAVTFVTATAFLAAANVAFESHMVALLAVMESPAIVSGLFLARRALGTGTAPKRLSPPPLGIVANVPTDGSATPGLDRSLAREVLLNGSIVLLTGALLIGFLTKDAGLVWVKPALIDPFKGVLAIFLLDMGLTAGKGLGEFRRLGLPLVIFGLTMPLFGAALGAVVGTAIGLSVGGTTLLAVLAASASYIAVPAAMRVALPQANPSLYLTMSLGITFPFNIVFGIPLYYRLATLIQAWL